MKNQKLHCPFSHKFKYQFGWNSVCCHNLLVCWSPCEIYFAQILFKGENCWHDFMKYMFSIVVCWDTCELICFKLGLMLSATKLYSLVPDWMTMMFTQGHMVMGKLELGQSFCCKVAWSNSNLMVDYVKEMTVKKFCKYGEYNNNYNERISRAPFHVKYAQLGWTGANTKYKTHAYKTPKAADFQIIMLQHLTEQLKKKYP